MQEGRINLYSDTQTRPSRAMRQAMIEAEVGDEQLGLDPTADRLCRRVADILGKDDAVFLPSGTMCNQIAMLLHCRPGDEIYAHRSSHVIRFEGGGAAALAAAAIYPLDGERGMFTAETLSGALREESRYAPRPRVVVIEQTTNMGGGAVWSPAEIEDVAQVARTRDMRLHLDGARLFHAVVASGVSARRFCEPFDSAWIDLSKGLGCPIGAVLAGSESFIRAAWRWKQRLGGAMRQSGMLAAAGLYALEHHVERLAEDHENARRFAKIVGRCPGVRIVPDSVETNIVFLDLSEVGIPARDIQASLEERGVNLSVFGELILRAVTHLDVDRAQVEEAGYAVADVLEALREAPRSARRRPALLQGY